jgi:uncharacterized protein (TIGR03663 family)
LKSRSRKRLRSAPGVARMAQNPGPAPATGQTAPAADLTAPVSVANGPSDAGQAPGLMGQVDRWFVPAAVVIVLVAAALRLPELALNPFHHDEGVNGFFTTNLVRQGTYVYDPANYHGPSLYYFAVLSELVFGLTTEAMRLVPVVFGLLMVGLVLPLRRYLGTVAVLTAAALLAVSPGAVYISRYFIHETLLVALTLALAVAVIFYIDRRQQRYLLAGAAAAALLFATKETGILTVAVLVIALAVARVYVDWRTPRRPTTRPRRQVQQRRSVWIEGVEYRPAMTDGPDDGPPGSWSRVRIPREQLAAAAVVFLVIYVLLYSSFFTNFPKGLIDSLATFTIWAQHGESTQVQPIYRYLQWLIPVGAPGMIPVDVPILALGVAGGLIAAIRANDRLWVVIGLWAAGITSVYSIIQYKTPWILLNMLLPLALLGGLAVQEAVRLVRAKRIQWRLGVPLALGAAIAISGYQAIDLNYNRYDDQAYPYVYVHSTRDMLSLVAEVEATARRAGTGTQTGIVFVSSEYWPLPWYFRDYPRAGFYGQIVDTQEAMIVANVTQEAELEPKITGAYEKVGTYNLRPGVDLALYVRSDIP